ncbi:TIR-like protein FxsC [Streptomyces bacillaris]|uniref:TIR-like protein FxsC n=1 Tax=Streptomyces bacillaris TaxID=68179 RepID=UPI0035DABDDB
MPDPGAPAPEPSSSPPPDTEEGSARRPDDPLLAVVAALQGLGRKLDAVAISEVLWLAARHQRPVRSPGGQAGGPQAGHGRVDPREKVGVWAPSPGSRTVDPSVGDGLRGRKVALPRGSALPRAREIARSLRPLRRSWRSGRRLRLDIDATVSAYARTEELLPVFRPAPERWFDLRVFIDRSPTMSVWSDTAEELVRVLARTGAFRTVRVGGIASGRPAPTTGADQPPTVPARSPQPRRLVLVFSDCAGDRRWEPLLHGWASWSPTLLVNPLPPRIWRYSGLDLPAVRVTPPRTPGPRNTELRYAVPPLLDDEASTGTGSGTGVGPWVPVPVASLSPRSLGLWARTLMRAAPEGCEAVLLTGGSSPRTVVAAQPATNAVEAFLHRASTEAIRLGVLASSYPALPAALLDVIRQELVPEADAADVAEFVVGGLVSLQTSPEPGLSSPLLRFETGVRERLAPRLGVRDAARVQDAVDAFLSSNAAARGRFPALVADPAGGTEISPGTAPIAAISRDALPEPVEAGPGGRTVALGPAVERSSARPARPRPSAERERPYFFLSYARTPRHGRDGQDADLWVERLFRDLCGHVLAMSNVPTGVPAGFMDREIRSGENWSERLSDVLSRCRVFVPLYSPRYFASETCGREWYAFEARAKRRPYPGAAPATAPIVPALWVPVPAGQLPDVASRLPYSDRGFGEQYATDGLYGLIKLRRFAEQYERAVYELAKRIVVAADTSPGDGPVIDYRTVPSAFHSPLHQPDTLRVAVAAPTRHNLPDGPDPSHYGDTPEEWNPYSPASPRPLADAVIDLAFRLNSQVDVSTLAEEVRRIDDGHPSPGPLLLLVDRWAPLVPELRHQLARLDAAREPGTTVIVGWDPQDGRATQPNSPLAHAPAPEQAMPHLADLRISPFFPLQAPEGLTSLLPRALEAAYHAYSRGNPSPQGPPQ